MTAGPAGGDEGAAAGRPGRSLAVHVGLLCALLAITAPFVDLGTAWISDEGRYALQAEALRDGSWQWEASGQVAPVHVADADAVLGPGAALSVTPYPHHPLWAVLLAASTSAAGVPVGLHLISALGTVALAAASWSLARRLGAPGWLGFWAAAVSPALVNGHLAWAHAPSAALSGLAVVAALRLLDVPDRWGSAAALAGAVGLSVLLRSESLLFAAAVVVGACGVSLARRRWRPALTIGAVVTAAAVAAELVERSWIRSITTERVEDLEARGQVGGLGDFLSGRLSGARQVLLEGGDVVSGGLLLSLTALVLTAGAAVLLRRGSETTHPVLLIGVAGLLYPLRMVLEPANTVSGILAAWPLAVAGLVLVPWRRVASDAVFATAVSALFMVAVLAVQYEQGGAYEWGGRFLSPLTAPVAAVAAVGLAHLGRFGREAPVAAFGVLAAGPALAGIVNLAAVRDDVAAVEAAVRAHAGPVVVTDVASLPYRLWPTLDHQTWVVVEPAGLDETARDLAAGGPVSVVTHAGRVGEGAGRPLPQDLVLLPAPNTRSSGGR